MKLVRMASRLGQVTCSMGWRVGGGAAGSTLVTAGGSSLCVWDLLAGGRLLLRAGSHRKTVTCLAAVTLGGSGPEGGGVPRLLAADLNADLKAYDYDTFQVPQVAQGRACPASTVDIATRRLFVFLALQTAQGSK